MNKVTEIIANAIVLRFANAGISDDIDLMRCYIFGMELAKITDEQKGSVSFFLVRDCKSLLNLPFCVDDHALQDIIEQAERIYAHFKEGVEE